MSGILMIGLYHEGVLVADYDLAECEVRGDSLVLPRGSMDAAADALLIHFDDGRIDMHDLEEVRRG